MYRLTQSAQLNRSASLLWSCAAGSTAEATAPDQAPDQTSDPAHAAHAAHRHQPSVRKRCAGPKADLCGLERKPSTPTTTQAVWHTWRRASEPREGVVRKLGIGILGPWIVPAPTTPASSEIHLVSVLDILALLVYVVPVVPVVVVVVVSRPWLVHPRM